MQTTNAAGHYENKTHFVGQASEACKVRQKNRASKTTQSQLLQRGCKPSKAKRPPRHEKQAIHEQTKLKVSEKK